jgi:hypothetical protein
MAYLWEKTDRGRYAAAYDGHLLEVIRNPDYPEDTRRYQPCVDHSPIDTPKHSLKAAQTAAMQHVERLNVTASYAAQERQAERRRQEEPEPVIVYAEYQPVEEPEPPVEEMEPLPLPPPAEEPRTVTFTITGTVTTRDHIHAMQEIRAAVDMLRSVADTACRIVPPDFIDL